MAQPKILLLDIETAPILAYVWGLWDNNVSLNQIRRDWYMLSWAAKWLGADEVLWDALPYNKNYADDTEDDSAIISSIRNLLDDADIVVGHNGNRFDLAKINAKCLQYGIPPPSPYRKVDTLIEAKRHFKLSSNKLDYIASLLGFGRKIKTDFDLWVGCMDGDGKSWDKMIKYNKKDVILLEKVYLKMRPWMTNHPNVGIFLEGDKCACPKCGGEKLQWRGYTTTNLSRYKRFQCQDCGGWGRARTNDADRTHLVAGA